MKQSRLYDAFVKALSKKQTDFKNVQPAAQTEISSRAHYGRILLVDDVPDNLNLAKRILIKNRYQVETATEGREAVDLFKKFDYDVVLMDIQMPVMDGFAATSEIRAWEKEQKREPTPIIAVTAHALQGYRKTCLNSGMDDYLTKPIQKKGLLSLINKWLDDRPNILIADDSADNCLLLSRNLQKSGKYRFVTANNGREAVEFVRRRGVSLVLMDVEMPDMNGPEATAEIRKLETGGDIPIIALTAHQEEKEMRKCMQAGCTAFLSKPVKKADLFRKIDELLVEQSEASNVTVVNDESIDLTPISEIRDSRKSCQQWHSDLEFPQT